MSAIQETSWRVDIGRLRVRHKLPLAEIQKSQIQNEGNDNFKMQPKIAEENSKKQIGTTSDAIPRVHNRCVHCATFAAGIPYRADWLPPPGSTNRSAGLGWTGMV